MRGILLNSGGEAMKLQVYSYTNKGARDNNEDYFGYWTDNDEGVFVVADGLGGHDCGEVASQLAVNYILKTTHNNLSLSDENLLGIMNNVNKEIIKCQNANAHQKCMRTTIVAGFVKVNNFKYFNVGDSRLYYFKNGCLYIQSKDHSVSQLTVDLGEIPQEQIRFHDDRNKLLKVLGDTDNLNIKTIDDGITIENGDAFLLCSDGFWEYVFETEMELDLVKSSSPKEWCEFMTKRLLHRVTNNNDNFSAICAMVNLVNKER